MQRLFGERLSVVVMRSTLGDDKKLGEPDLKTAAFIGAMKTTLETMKSEFHKLGLSSCLHQVERIESSFGWVGRTYQSVPISIKPEELSRMFNELSNRLTDELKGVYLLSLSEKEAEFYETSSPPFGIEVQTNFTTAIYDIEEASKCYALERSTASAFHSIRSLEAAIRALSRCLGIPDPTRGNDRSWGKMLSKIKDEVDRRWPGNNSRVSGDGKFFDGAYAALAAMKNPYRDSTMHLDEKYTLDEARHIMEIVKGFMKKIALRMDEGGLPLA
jgi:hypothetical protein